MKRKIANTIIATLTTAPARIMDQGATDEYHVTGYALVDDVVAAVAAVVPGATESVVIDVAHVLNGKGFIDLRLPGGGPRSMVLTSSAKDTLGVRRSFYANC